MTVLILFALAILILFAITEARAHRRHESVQTVIHAEIAALKTDIENLDAKFDGGAIHK
jgi:sensor domain CHASE-containing protein